MVKIDRALFLINMETFKVGWSTLDNSCVSYWYKNASERNSMIKHDNQPDDRHDSGDWRYIYVEL